MILSASKISAKEILVNEHKPFTPQYDGVFISEKRYKDYVFKSRRYEALKSDYIKLTAECEKCEPSSPYVPFLLGIIGGIITIKTIER